MKHKKQKGFTLIELLVVIAIIGILAAMVLVALNSARQKARDARRQSDVRNIQLALEIWNDANGGEYPTAAEYNGTFNGTTYFPGGKLPADPGSYSYIYNAATDQSTYNIQWHSEANNANHYVF